MAAEVFAKLHGAIAASPLGEGQGQGPRWRSEGAGARLETPQGAAAVDIGQGSILVDAGQPAAIGGGDGISPSPNEVPDHV